MIDNKNNNFFPFVHFLRGIAPLLVIWAHLCGWWLGVNNTTSNLDIYWGKFIVQPFHLYQNGGHLGVLIFFLISGFIVTHVSLNETVKEFIAKRFFRIMPTLVLALIITKIVVIINQYLNLSLPLGTQSNALKDYIYTLFFINRSLLRPDVLSVTWSLIVEVAFYLITALFIVYTRKDPLKSTLYILLILIIVILFSSINPIIKKTADHIIYVFYIMIGRIICLHEKKLISTFNAVLLGFNSLFLYIMLYDYLLPNRMFTSPINLIYSDIIAISIFLISMIFINKSTPIISFFADISYSVYLLHIPIGSFILNYFTKNGLSFEISLVSAISFSILLSYFVNNFFEIPVQQFARKLISNRGWSIK